MSREQAFAYALPLAICVVALLVVVGFRMRPSGYSLSRRSSVFIGIAMLASVFIVIFSLLRLG